jgi:hypothetical protein
MVVYQSPDGAQRTYESPEAAMKAYADAGFRGHIRAIDVDAPPEKAKPAEPEGAFLRGEALRSLTDALSVKLPEPFFPEGTEMLASGKAKFRAYCREHEKMEPAIDVFRAASAQISNERRTFARVPLSSLHVDREGRLYREGGKGPIPLERNATAQLLQRAGHGSALWAWEQMDGALRSDYWERVVRKQDFGNKQVTLAARRGPNGHQFYAALGARYPEGAGADAILNAYVEALSQSPTGREARGEVVYNPVTLDLTGKFTWNAPEALDPKVGDVFRVGGYFKTNDAGSGSFQQWLNLVRIVCINCTIADASGAVQSRVHRGNLADAIQPAVDAFVQQGVDVGRQFLQHWHGLRRMEVDAEALIQELVDVGAIPVVFTPEGTVAALHEALAADATRTGSAADVVNAVTYAAHTPPLWDGLLSEIEQWELERLSASLTRVLVSEPASHEEVPLARKVHQAFDRLA